MNTPPFDRAAAMKNLGPAGVARIRRSVADAPPLRTEQREQIRAVFASARCTAGPGQSTAAAA